MSVFKKWQRQQQRDKDALKKLFESDPPPGAADIPLGVAFGWGGRTGQILGLLLGLLGPIFLHIILDFPLNLAIFFEIAFLLLAVASTLPDFTNLNTAVTISGEGVRLEKVHRTYVIPWWQVVSVQATPDLTGIRVNGQNARITLAAENLPPERRIEIAQALRARQREYGADIEEWPRRSRILRTIAPVALSLAASALFVAGGNFFGPGGTLGLRCSVNSAFLQETFDAPDRQGCVALRVSAGAAKAGIQRGDLVIEMEGIPVTSGQQYQRIFEASDPPWEFVVIREDQRMHFEVKGGRGRNFREDSSDPFFYYLRGRWDASEKPEHAIQDYTRAIALEPRFDLAYLYRGNLYADQGDIDAADRDFEMAVALSPNTGEVHEIIAHDRNGRGNKESEEAIKKAIELNNCERGFEQWNYDCALDYSLLAHLQGYYDEDFDVHVSIRTAEQAIGFYPDLPDPYFILASAYLVTDDPERARQYAAKYLSFPKDDLDSGWAEQAESIRDS